jgi:hypothetical protein
VWCGEFGSEPWPAPKPVLGQADAHSVRVSSRRHILLAALLGCVWGAAMAIAGNSYGKTLAAEPMPLHGWDGARALLECALRSLDGEPVDGTLLSPELHSHQARPWTRLLATAPESSAPQMAPTMSWQRIVAMLGSLQTQLNKEITPLDNRTRITAGAWRLRRTHRQAAPAARSAMEALQACIALARERAGRDPARQLLFPADAALARGPPTGFGAGAASRGSSDKAEQGRADQVGDVGEGLFGRVGMWLARSDAHVAGA